MHSWSASPLHLHGITDDEECVLYLRMPTTSREGLIVKFLRLAESSR